MNWDSLQLFNLDYSLTLILYFLVPFLGVVLFTFIFILPVCLFLKFTFHLLEKLLTNIFCKKNTKQSILSNSSNSAQNNFHTEQLRETLSSGGHSSLSSAQDVCFWDTGKTGERYMREALSYLEGYKQFVSNCYIPKDDGTFTEIDLVLIHESGIYVLESKNYSGWIFGNENQKQWIQSLPSGRGYSKKTSFFNPIIQNKVHLKWLKKYLDIGQDIPVYSYIVFSDRCELKEVTLTTNEHIVINRRNLLRKVRRNAEVVGSKLSLEDIDSFYTRLFPLTQVTEEEKLLHIKTIEEKKLSLQKSPIVSVKKQVSSLSLVPESTRKCPLCGGDLVLRTARRGERAGKTFWGCSNYPKCRYIENIESSEN